VLLRRHRAEFAAQIDLIETQASAAAVRRSV
jgi:hypothetical protein